MPPSEWNLFVKKIYHEGKKKDSSYEFKQALKDASKRKSEMGHSSSSSSSRSRSRSHKKKKSHKKSNSFFGGKTRRRRRH